MRSVWWIITINANTENPVRFILRLEEIRSLAFQSRDAGAYWLQPKAYDREEFREAWHRLGTVQERNPSNHDRKMVRGDSATGPRNLLAAYGAIPKCKVELRTSTKLLFLLYNLVRSERFERPTLRFVV